MVFWGATSHLRTKVMLWSMSTTRRPWQFELVRKNSMWTAQLQVENRNQKFCKGGLFFWFVSCSFTGPGPRAALWYGHERLPTPVPWIRRIVEFSEVHSFRRDCGIKVGSIFGSMVCLFLGLFVSFIVCIIFTRSHFMFDWQRNDCHNNLVLLKNLWDRLALQHVLVH